MANRYSRFTFASESQARAAARSLRAQGKTIHAIDHDSRGWSVFFYQR